MEVWNVIGCVCVLSLAVFLMWWIWRRETAKRKVRRMSRQEKVEKLNALIDPFGFLYEARQEIFVSRVNAWQRKEGYESLYDRLASKFNMVIDAFPVYFDYREKTWMIEFWKGQYGINTGAEVGVYHTNRVVPKSQRGKVHYNSASDEEMPLIGLYLEKQRFWLFSVKRRHWWLAAFRMGMFSQPRQLAMRVSIAFHDPAAAQAFCVGLMEAGFTEDQYRVRNRRVSLRIEGTQEQNGVAKLQRDLVQGMNHFYCKLYHMATSPFTRTEDRMLFLYEMLPGCFRRMLRLHSFGRKARVK